MTNDARERARAKARSGRGGSGPFSSGAFLFVACLALGVIGGMLFPAAEDPLSDTSAWTVVVDGDGRFNWGVLLFFIAIGIVCFTIGVVGEAIVDAIRERDDD